MCETKEQSFELHWDFTGQEIDLGEKKKSLFAKEILYSSKCKTFFIWKPMMFGKWFSVFWRKPYSVQDQILKPKQKLEKKIDR